MTSFQRLLRGLNILNRYSGITEVDLNVDEGQPSLTSTLSPEVLAVQLHIRVPASIKVDAKDVDALAKMGWDQSDHNWTFQP